MKNKNGYLNGKFAIKEMIYLLENLWVERTLSILYARTIEEMNKTYQSARDSAIAFGEDVNSYPKRLRWKTEWE